MTRPPLAPGRMTVARVRLFLARDDGPSVHGQLGRGAEARRYAQTATTGRRLMPEMKFDRRRESGPS